MTFFASVLQLDGAAIKSLRITDTYSLHRVVYGLYEDRRGPEEKSASHPSGILYADQGSDSKGRKILMLANREPASGKNSHHGVLHSKIIPDGFLAHRNYRFKIIINPTTRDRASRKLLPVKGRDAIAQWFFERASTSWGFRVLREHLQVGRIDVLQFKGKDRQPITLAQALLQGQLEVLDSNRFTQSFSHGIGRGRAFGCGLLQIVPLYDNLFA